MLMVGKMYVTALIIILTLGVSSAVVTLRKASDLIKTGRTSPDPNDYFDDLGELGSMDIGEVIDIDENRQFVLTCQHYNGTKIESTCALIRVEKEYWTEWISIDTPADDGDIETISKIRETGVDICEGEVPKDALCRVKGVPFSQFREYTGSPPDSLATRCNPLNGLVCLNANQSSNQCSDYEIQFLCQRRLDTGEVYGSLYEGIENVTAPSIPKYQAMRTARRTAVRTLRMSQRGRVCIIRCMTRLVLDVSNGSVRHYYENRMSGIIRFNDDSVKHFIFVVLVNAGTNGVIAAWEEGDFRLDASGAGGNTKTGKYYFGRGVQALLDVKQGIYPLRCVMQNGAVKLVHNYRQDKSKDRRPYEYDCTTDNLDETNGAFSPLNDAFVGLTEMYELLFKMLNTRVTRRKVTARVHFGAQLDRTFWDPSTYSINIGDGGLLKYYPLVSFDILGHEFAHLYTWEHSNLRNIGESGCIGEAFADISGEANEFYITGKVDWKIAAGIVKSVNINEDALRYFECPEIDGHSISNYAQYTNQTEHECSGIYNRAFFKLAIMPGWDVMKAYRIFVLANFAFWKRCTTMPLGVCGLEDAARIYGYSVQDVSRAFDMVGLSCIPGVDECP